jgi:hypothetical protein
LTPTITPTPTYVGGATATPSPTPSPTPTATPLPRRSDDEAKPLTEQQRQQRQHTNDGNSDDYHTEGNVMAVEIEGNTVVIYVAQRDGIERVELECGASSACPDVRAGDYVEAEGTKENEALFFADEISVTRDGRRVR